MISNSEEASEAWALAWANELKPGNCVLLEGDLGAGKTVISRGICRGLGYHGFVHSPSYALVHEYPNSPAIFHIDLYRLPNGADLEEIGVDYYRFQEAITLIEWPQRLGNFELEWDYHIKIKHIDETSRKIEIIRNLDL
jgi:tRNA threonylcarbamoyladenosine biosynthesis protein TsaE